MKITKRSVTAATKSYIRAAEEDEEDFALDEEYEDSDGIMDSLDDVADNIEDIQDDLEDVQEDEVDIAINNNITDHYIAECSRCMGVFISAVLQSEQDIDHVTGTCPLCGKETDQYLKWVIKDVSTADKMEGM